ncbi:MAG: class I SAM-dependent RNA methyltransferase [Acetobacteraceae bacterium]|nr:class I SAM-dependent RNA methyltransferase [Acetobacteraceae bacterium]
MARLKDGSPLYVRGTLPGERIAVALAGRRGEGVAGRLIALLSPSPERVMPPCPHFGACGGCALQHVAPEAYAVWKRGLLVDSLARAGFRDVPVAALVPARPGTRRRADFALRPGVVGFHVPGSAAVVDVPGCLVLAPPLLALAEALRGLDRSVVRHGAEAQANLTETGLDVLLRLGRQPGRAETEALARFASAADLARLSVDAGDGPVPLAVRRTPRLTFGGVAVEPPPGAFLQATAEGELAIVSAVLEALADLPDGARVADLYAGLGTLAFPLARRFRVAAAEGDGAAATAVATAVRRAGLAGRITVQTRDLSLRPLLAADLAQRDAVVLDPPRDGAKVQARALAAAPSSLRRVVYVSCNPAALARDAKLLAAGGWRAVRAIPIDQFLWSPHLESVVVFAR